jgi:hypothetical protein
VKERDSGLVALVVLALAGLVAAPFAVTREAVSEATAGTAPAPTSPGAKPAEPERDVAGPLLADFLLPAERRSSRTTAETVDALRARGVAVRALVVTLPDPVDSILDYAFDRSLDAVQRAARADGYLLDRYFLPWLAGARAESRSEGEEPGSRGRSPGVLLFRKVTSSAGSGAGPRLELLAVFVVGETPISGLQKPALARALTEAMAITIREVGESPRRPELRILGPYFSGSALSLRLTLLQWDATREPALPVDVTVVSGTATVAWIKRALEQGPVGFEDPAARLAIRFSATVVPDRVTREYLYGYLQGLGVDFARVALLTESNTEYGQRWASRRNSRSGSPRGPEPGLSIVFPMHISQLRAAYEKDKLLQPLNDAKKPGAGPQTLDISLDDSAKHRDAIPSVSALSTASDELSLAAILATLSRRRIQYVGIVATDVRDKLFLARQIALNCPGVTLFSLDGDILLTHPKYAPFLRGMLVASTYPLYGQNQIWTPDERPAELLQFPAGTAQGVFNAFLVLLGNDRELVEYGPPFPQLVDPDPSSPRRRRPPVWLTVAGNTAAWPLDAFARYDDPDAFVHLRTVTTKEPPLARVLDDGDPRLTASRVSQFFLWALSLASVGLSVAFAAANRKEPGVNWDTVPVWPGFAEYLKRRPPENPTLARLRLDDDRRAPYRKDLLLLLLVVAVFVVQVLATSTFLQPYRLALRDPSAGLFSAPPAALAAAAGVLLALLATTITLAHAFVLSIRRESLLLRAEMGRLGRHPLRAGELSRLAEPARGRFLVARLRGTFEAVSGGALITLLFAAVSLTVYYAWPADLLGALLRFERLANPTSGLSILVPLLLLCLACASLAFCHLRRLTLDEWGGFEAALLGRRSSELSGAEAAERNILRTIRQIWVSPALSALLTLVFGFVLVWLLSRLLPAPEREPYQTLFRLAFFFGCLGTLFTAVRYFLLWKRLRVFLRILSVHPMADAFDRIPRRLAGAVGPRAFGRFISLPDFAALLHLWRLLKTGFEGVRPSLEASFGVKDPEAGNVLLALRKIDTLKFDYSGRLRRYGGKLFQTWKARVQTAESVARMARILQPVVEPYWRTKPLPGDAAIGEGPTDGRAIDPAALAWLRGAEEFLAAHLVIYVAYVFLHLRNLLSTYVLSALLLFVAITAYPFQPARFLVLFLLGFVLLLAAITIGTFLQMDRDEILSRVSRTPAGKVSWDFALLTRVFVYGIVPILGVVSASIPEVQTGLSSVIDSISRVIK